jgi:hypothetical protein
LTRLVAVLGYSDRKTPGLHRICALRLRRARELSGPTDIVFLSGWARHRSTDSEAELMRRAWRGEAAAVISDPGARTTAENARSAEAIAREHGVCEVLVVTSAWHAPRAGLIFRTTLRRSGVRTAVAPVRDGLSPGLGLREALRWPLVPLQLALARPSNGSLRG